MSQPRRGKRIRDLPAAAPAWARRLRERYERSGLSIGDVSAALRADLGGAGRHGRDMTSRYLSGLTEPPATVAVGLARVLGFRVEDVFG